MSKPKRKNIIQTMLEERQQKNLIGVVIGVGGARNIPLMFENLDIKKLYLIDPFVPMETCGPPGFTDDYVRMKPDAMKVIGKYDDKIVFIEDYAQRVVDSVPDDLDFVYIDVFGDYANNMEIFRSYFSKVRNGGVFCGKYYTSRWPYFKKALKDFERKKGIKINKITRGVANGDWWVVKDSEVKM